MKRAIYSITLSLIALSSIALATTAHAGPLRISSVRQIVNSNPNKQIAGGGSAELVIAPPPQDAPKPQQNGDSAAPQPQDTPPRVITEEEFEVTEDTEPCNCPEPPQVKPFTSTKGGGFPWWLGFGGVPPLLFCCGGGDSPSPSPSATTPNEFASPTPSPSVSPSVVPSVSPSVLPSVSPSLPPNSPTPPPEVPEPTTILLFGTGLTSIGFAARRWMRRKDEDNHEE